MLSMTDRSLARVALVQEARFQRGEAASAARRPAVRRYKLVRLSPLTGPVSERFAHLRGMHD
jgi:hypothetical protein